MIQKEVRIDEKRTTTIRAMTPEEIEERAELNVANTASAIRLRVRKHQEVQGILHAAQPFNPYRSCTCYPGVTAWDCPWHGA